MHENREISEASRSHQDRDRSAKALSHKAGMHVSEKSDRAEVPMNQPNKGEQSSAEVGEGRARIKENIGKRRAKPGTVGVTALCREALIFGVRYCRFYLDHCSSPGVRSIGRTVQHARKLYLAMHPGAIILT